MSLSERLGTKTDAVLNARDKAVLRLAAYTVAVRRTSGLIGWFPSDQEIEKALKDVMDHPEQFNNYINYAEERMNWFVRG